MVAVRAWISAQTGSAKRPHGRVSINIKASDLTLWDVKSIINQLETVAESMTRDDEDERNVSDI